MAKKFLSVCYCIIALLVSCAGTYSIDPSALAPIEGLTAQEQFTSGNFPAALAQYERACTTTAPIDQPRRRARCFFDIGRVFYELGIADSAREAVADAYREFLEYRDRDGARAAAGLLALVYVRSNNFDSAFAWYLRGRPPKLRGNRETAFWLGVQAKLCMISNRIPQAQAYLDRAMECYEKERMFGRMAIVDYDRASVAYSLGDYTEARDRLTQSLASLDKAPERYARWKVLLGQATVSFCLKDKGGAERLYNQALACVPRGIKVVAIDSVKICPKNFYGD